VLNRVVDNFFAETEQVAFCTQNIVDGIDFTNDPLLQGRNFSYLDTQLKRLGSPNFTDLPINAPKCPFANFQQDGHMALVNPVGRVNYEPNSWSGAESGPREDPIQGFRSFAAEERGEKRRLRPESFADHYSQARQFYRSQTGVEQQHICDAFVFELSKVERVDIRRRQVANLRNVDEDLAQRIAEALGFTEVPDRSAPAREPIGDLEPSVALSIIANGVGTFEGRKVGVLVDDGAGAELLDALEQAIETEGARLELVAPKVGGFTADDGARVEANQMIGGGPSVLYDAVILLTGAPGAASLNDDSAAVQFVADAYTHRKFIGYVESARPLLEAAGIADRLDGGLVLLNGAEAVPDFIRQCRELRFWDREALVLQS
jgi:catalase